MMMNWKGFGRSDRDLILRHYPGIHLEGLSRSPGRDLNPEPSEYEAGVLTTRPRR
jgi:hypothetical protein